MQYDRHADVRGPLGRRRDKPVEEAVEEEVAAEEKPRKGLFGLGRKQEEEVYEEVAEEVAEPVEGEVLDAEPEPADSGEYKPAN